jgi:hypothetical protein
VSDREKDIITLRHVRFSPSVRNEREEKYSSGSKFVHGEIIKVEENGRNTYWHLSLSLSSHFQVRER